MSDEEGVFESASDPGRRENSQSSDDGFGRAPSWVKSPSSCGEDEAKLSAPSAAQLEQSVQDAVWKQSRGSSASLRFPWEGNSYLDKVFDSNKRGWPFTELPGVPPPPIVAIGEPAEDLPVSKRPKYSFAFRKLRQAKWTASEDVLRERALVKWRCLIELDLDASKLGLQITDLCSVLTSEAEIVSSRHRRHRGTNGEARDLRSSLSPLRLGVSLVLLVGKVATLPPPLLSQVRH